LQRALGKEMEAARAAHARTGKPARRFRDFRYRTLQRYFRSIYGVTPHVWFRCMKLNAVRGELRQSSVATVRISDIAARWGFLHFGRFAEDYRKLFGERPKDTLRS
jgi:AraC family ethanolamine operon transcriptional activator